MNKALKGILKGLVRYSFSKLPFPVAKRLVKLFADPRIAMCLPEGHNLIFHEYNGTLSVVIDTVYPIERMMLSGTYTVEMINIIDFFVKQDYYVLDIGANVGAITLLMAKIVGATGKVFAFEPGPPTYERLMINLDLNPSLNEIVIPINVGLSDKSGNLLWSEDMNNRGNAWLLGEHGIPVKVVTVDSFFQENGLTRLDFVKIDVEGMEFDVLKGGLNTWQKFKPIIYFETLEAMKEVRGRDIYYEIERLLNEIGYKLYSFFRDAEIKRVTADNLTSDTIAIHESLAI